MRKMLLLLTLFAGVHIAHSQADERMVVGVAKFTSEVDSPFADAVAEKVVQIVTNTHRFIVVDRTSYDKIKEELEFQKTEAFLDSKNTVKQDVAVAAQRMIVGHLVKMNIYTMKNTSGGISGYKASAAFTLKVNDVETGMVTEAESFQTTESPLAASKEQAVNQALASLDETLRAYIAKTFPVSVKIVKVLENKKDAATKVLIGGGKTYGIKEGDNLRVEAIEMIDGMPYPTEIGELKVTSLAGENFAECKVTKGGKQIASQLASGNRIQCTLIVK
ncbi:MAG: penicillin-binding protein activator LpoB [Bacteroidales bacterium]|nr:penicillin-binding protein activator LpoB [Bacteroidales bacterium]